MMVLDTFKLCKLFLYTGFGPRSFITWEWIHYAKHCRINQILQLQLQNTGVNAEWMVCFYSTSVRLYRCTQKCQHIKNSPVLISKNLICLSSCAVTTIGWVGWGITLFICVKGVPSVKRKTKYINMNQLELKIDQEIKINLESGRKKSILNGKIDMHVCI